MFDLPDLSGLEEVVVNKDVVDNEAKPVFVYSDRQEDLETSA